MGAHKSSEPNVSVVMCPPDPPDQHPSESKYSMIQSSKLTQGEGERREER